MRDPYKVLGVMPDAGQDEIKAAWRHRAKAVHPDHNQQDPLAAQRFAEVGSAYETLKDPGKRSRYDTISRMSQTSTPGQTIMQQRQAREAAAKAKAAQAKAERVMEELARANALKAAAAAQKEAAAEPAEAKGETPEQVVERIFGTRPGAEQAAQASQSTASSSSAASGEQKPGATAKGSAASPEAGEDVLDADQNNPSSGEEPRPAFGLLGSILRRFKNGPLSEKAPDIAAEATVTIDDILKSAWVSVALSDGREVRFQASSGMRDGQVLSLKGQGLKLQGIARGDVAITLHVPSDPRFQLSGLDVTTTLPVTIEDAVLGCTKTVEGPAGPVDVIVPAWSGSDRVIRIAGAGLANAAGERGDFIVELRLMLWEKPDEKITDLMRSMKNGLYL